VDVQAWGERAAVRVKGLLEPLRLLEVDGVRHAALLRSQEPAQRGDALAYYEVLLQGDGGASVRRYQGTRQGDKRREQVPFSLTHEVLARLADDLIAAA
jgi:hypothetical protein